MALKGVNMTNPQDTAQAPATPATPKPVRPTMELELSLYTNLTVGTGSHTITYEKGKVYKFDREVALQLLQDADAGRPVWKQHRKFVPRLQQTGPIDVTHVKMQADQEPIHGVDTSKNRIDIGDDSEIEDIIGPAETDEGNVEVP